MKKNSLGHFRLYLWCLSFLKKYWIYVIAYFILVVLQQACFIIFPKLIQRFIDDVVIGKQISLVKDLAIYAMLTICVIIATRLIYAMCGLVFSEKGTKVIQYKVIDKARELGYDYFEKTPRGNFLAETFQNILSIYFIYVDFLPNTMQLFCGFVFSTVMILLSHNIFFICITFFCFLCVIVTTVLSSKMVHNTNEKIRDSTNLYYKGIYDSTESIAEIRSYNSVSWIEKKVFDKLSLIFSDQRKGLLLQKLVSGSINLFHVIAIAAYFILGIALSKNSMSIGNVVAYYTYVFMAISTLSNFMNLLIRQNKNLTDAEKPYAFMHLKPTVKEHNLPTLNKIEGNICAKNLSFHYEGKEDILQDFSLSTTKGEKIVIVGASGCGKSTFFKLLLRCYDCCKGDLLLDGVSIKHYSFHDLREAVGIAFQETFLFSDTILENLRFANPNATFSDIIKASKLAQAHEFIMNLPKQYNTVLGARGETLSGGQKQRLAIARVILKNPKIFLLDEITSNLDSITEAKILSDFLTIFKDKTLIMISHRLSVIRQFDRLVVMNEGKIVEDGTFDDLFKEGTYFYSLVARGMITHDK
ncbi:MAG: ABC transporter ATP-binding protein/permease [Clostridia bacterium]|nr:ABC transporter ATP-binding protein/permease [Clostridia bacterium]